MQPLTTNHGFTLLELLVVMTIVAVLTTFAIPGFAGWVERRHTDADRALLATTIYGARTAAIHLNQPVVMCPGDDQGCGRRNSWHEGAVVFADPNRNGRLDRGETLVGGFGALNGTVQWRSFRNRSYLRFLPNGLTDWQNGHFLLCPTTDDPDLARQLVLNRAGRLYFSIDADGDGRHEDVQDNPLEC